MPSRSSKAVGSAIPWLRIVDRQMAEKGYPEEDREKILFGWITVEACRLLNSLPPYPEFVQQLKDRHEKEP